MRLPCRHMAKRKCSWDTIKCDGVRTPVSGGSVAYPPDKTPSRPPKLKYETLKLVEFFPIFQCKATQLKIFWYRFWFQRFWNCKLLLWYRLMRRATTLIRAPTWRSAAPGRVEKCRPWASREMSQPKPRVKTKSNLSERNYFIAMHHQVGVNFENFTEVKFRDILLIGTNV